MIGTIFKNPAALFYAVVVHAALLAVLVISFDWSDEDEQQPKLNVVEATTVDESKVLKQIEKLKQQELRKKQAEEARQRKLENKAKEAKQARQIEEKRLAEAKKKREHEAKMAVEQKKKRQAEEKKEKQRLADLKQKQATEAKRQKELEQKRKQEEKRLAKAQKEAKEAEAKRKREDLLAQMRAEEEERTKRRRQEEQKERERQMAAEQSVLNAEKEKQALSVVQKYKIIIRQKIESKWIKPSSAKVGMSTTIAIQLIPSGDVVNVETIKSSGDKLYDRSVETAVRKVGTFPLPPDPDMFERFRKMNLIFKEES